MNADTGITPEHIREDIMEVIQGATKAGIRVSLLTDCTLMIQRVSGRPRPAASIRWDELPAARQWDETPDDATLDSKPGDAVRCPSHDAPAVIKSNDSALIYYMGRDGDKFWVLDCGCTDHVKVPR